MTAVQTVLRTDYRNIMRWSIPYLKIAMITGLISKNNTLLLNSYMWASNSNFISQFNHVFFFPLRLWKTGTVNFWVTPLIIKFFPKLKC